MLKFGILLAALAVGLGLQRLHSQERIRDLIWIASFWAVIPILVFATFVSIEFDHQLVLAIVAAIAATYVVVGLGYLYARSVADERDERGALALGASVGNTGFIGYPLAQLLFGHRGLELAVVYDQLSFGVPMSSLSTVVARLHGRRAPDAAGRSRLAIVLLNPPLWALFAALVLRGAGVDVPFAGSLESLMAALVGPMGFLMLGISIPLDAIEHERTELFRAAGTIAIKLGAGPLALLAIGRAIGADVPSTFYLLAAMPAAFHLLVLARVYDVRPALMRLLVVGSTVPVVIGVAIASFFTQR